MEILLHRLLVLFGYLHLSDSRSFLRPEPGVKARLLLQVVAAASMRGGASVGALLLPLCRWTRWVPVVGEETRLSDQHIPSGPFAATTRNVTPGGATGGKSAVAFLALLLKEGRCLLHPGQLLIPLTLPGSLHLAPSSGCQSLKRSLWMAGITVIFS